MMIGLFFFIRASVKDRTKQIQLIPSETEDILLKKLQKYFENRAYQLTSVDPENKQITFRGFVQPSIFLAILLSLLAVVGFSCLALILFLLFPNSNNLVWLLTILSPLAGVFYWRKAGRWEEILLRVVSRTDSPNLVSITAHRDELIQLEENLSVQTVEKTKTEDKRIDYYRIVILINLDYTAIAMQYFCTSLLTLSLLVTGNMAVAESSIKSEGSDRYPEDFVREYATECIQTSMGEGLAEEEAQKLCDCTISKFQSQYELAEFKQLTVDSLEDEQAEAVLVEVGQICFEEILYEQ